MTLWEEAILRGKGASHCKGQGHFVTSVVTCAKTAQPIEMPFESWALMGPWNRVRRGFRSHHGKGQFWGKGAHCKV